MPFIIVAPSRSKMRSSYHTVNQCRRGTYNKHCSRAVAHTVVHATAHAVAYAAALTISPGPPVVRMKRKVVI